MSKVVLNVKRADNQLVAFLNNVEVYNKRTENNPALNDVLDLSDKMDQDTNVLMLMGVNWGGPADIEANLTVDGAIVNNWKYSQESTSNGICWYQTYLIPKDETAPTIERVPVGTHPSVPDGLKATFMTGPNSPRPDGSSSTCDIISLNENTYWAYSYIDNRSSFGLVAYNSSGNVAKTMELPGARYLWKITNNVQAQTITFYGQSSATATIHWDDLKI